MTPSEEFGKLSKLVRRSLKDVDGWTNLREAMLEEFGAPDDPDTAIPRINAYYATLVDANFPPVDGVKGRKSPVHPNLKTRLDAAVALLQAKGKKAVLAKLTNAGGLSIRKNKNNPLKLSDHSFGWAFDLDPDLNPNIKREKLPEDLILKITAVDIYGAESTRLRTPRTYAATLPDVTVLSEASATFVSAFKDLAALKKACRKAITRLYTVTLNAATTDKAFGFATEPANDPALRNLLSGAGIAAGRVDECAIFLKDAIALLTLAQKPGVKPDSKGTKASVTKFGFFNLPVPLVAALIASDGAALFWLGTSDDTKDYMHSQLFDVDRPDLF